jgi:hypothetical protein
LQSKDTNKNGVESKLIDLKDFLWILKAVAKGWYLLLVLPIIFAVIGAFMAYKKTAVYTTQTQILLKSNDVYDYQSGIFKSVGYSDLYTDIANQMRVIKSYDLIQQALEGLDFETSYYIVGRVNTKEYFKNVPFKVKLTPFRGDLYEKIFQFDVLSTSEYQIQFELDGEVKTSVHQFNKEEVTDWYTIKTTATNMFLKKENISNIAKYEFVVHNSNYWIDRIMANLLVENLEYTSILSVSLQDEIPERSNIFLDS